MNFVSVRGESPAISFHEALLRGIAPDGSLYIPERIPALPNSFLNHLDSESLHSVGTQVASLFIDEIPAGDVRKIIEQAWNFEIPLVHLEENLFLLELFRGPTLAFKDVGARFMAHALSYFLKNEQREITIIVATSGDTGSAVAHGFYNVPHCTVYVLYPSGKISKLQEQQMTTLGGNIHAVEVLGTFDDCQKLVKQSLADQEILRARTVTTANSMNLGRLIPQIAYYVWGFAQLQRLGMKEHPTVVVPSGNFGNITAAVYAKGIGTPIEHFVAATNANDVVPEYLSTGTFTPRASVQTCSNAMDVGNPSNLARLQAFYRNDLHRMRGEIHAVRASDEETLGEIRNTFERTGYVLDPHTAVGVFAARRAQRTELSSRPLMIAATAHPGKFPDIVQQAIGEEITLPPALRDALSRPKQSTVIPAHYEAWKKIILHAG